MLCRICVSGFGAPGARARLASLMTEALGLSPQTVEQRLAAQPPWVAQGDAHDALQLSVMLGALTGVELSTFPGFGAADELGGAAQRATQLAAEWRRSTPPPAQPPAAPGPASSPARTPAPEAPPTQPRGWFQRLANAVQQSASRSAPTRPVAVVPDDRAAPPERPPSAERRRSDGPAPAGGGFSREGAITRSGGGAPAPKRLPLSARGERRRSVVQVTPGEDASAPAPASRHRRLADLPTLELDWEAAGRTPTPAPKAVAPHHEEGDDPDGPGR